MTTKILSFCLLYHYYVHIIKAGKRLIFFHFSYLSLPDLLLFEVNNLS